VVVGMELGLKHSILSTENSEAMPAAGVGKDSLEVEVAFQ